MEIISFPVRLVQPRMAKQPADDTALLIECMDLLSKRLCGCISAILPTEDHAVFLGSVEQLLDGLERNRLERIKGQAN
jgi:hypothetical protein